MIKLIKILTLITLAMSIFNCSPNIKDYKNTEPKLNLVEYFKGKTEAFGMLQGVGGLVKRRFKVTMEGKFEDDIFILDEKFVFDDGEEQERIWKVSIIDENHFTATAGDIIGTAEGSQYGSALEMDYVLTISYKGKKMNVSVNDWMYLIDEKSLINTSKIKKFGITVAKLTIGFKKLD